VVPQQPLDAKWRPVLSFRCHVRAEAANAKETFPRWRLFGPGEVEEVHLLPRHHLAVNPLPQASQLGQGASPSSAVAVAMLRQRCLCATLAVAAGRREHRGGGRRRASGHPHRISVLVATDGHPSDH